MACYSKAGETKSKKASQQKILDFRDVMTISILKQGMLSKEIRDNVLGIKDIRIVNPR